MEKSNVVFFLNLVTSSDMVPIVLQNMLIRSICWLKRLPIQIKVPFVTTECWQVVKEVSDYIISQTSKHKTSMCLCAVFVDG